MSRYSDEIFLKKSCFFLFELLPFANLVIETCHQDITKIIVARSFKHGQLVEDDE